MGEEGRRGDFSDGDEGVEEGGGDGLEGWRYAVLAKQGSV